MGTRQGRGPRAFVQVHLLNAHLYLLSFSLSTQGSIRSYLRWRWRSLSFRPSPLSSLSFRSLLFPFSPSPGLLAQRERRARDKNDQHSQRPRHRQRLPPGRCCSDLAQFGRYPLGCHPGGHLPLADDSVLGNRSLGFGGGGLDRTGTGPERAIGRREEGEQAGGERISVSGQDDCDCGASGSRCCEFESRRSVLFVVVDWMCGDVALGL